MTSSGKITDTRALAARRARATARSMFLQESAADEIEDRLSMVNRPFTRPAVVTPFPQLWRDRLPDATLVADDDTLALEEGAHDLVVHALCLHWANDSVGQLIQCRRALRPDGLLLACSFGGQTLQELRRCLAEAEIALTGGLSPRVAPMGEIRDLGALLQRAGFALPVADSVTQTAAYRDALHLMHDLRGMGEANALAARRRTIPPKPLFAAADRIYRERFPAPDGRIAATFEMVFLTGWAPGPDQPKPLRPGSAKARLADALKVPEVPLRD